jgi:hypothetical protein
LVETTDNFGAMGREPTHPELLDYLATRFVQNDWSTKQLIREIVLTHTFRLSSTYDAGRASIDPENRLLWRANRRRVDAEVLRDSLLAVSGELDLQAGGLTIRKLTEYDLGYEFDTLRRSVYVPAFRNSMLDLFEVFDLANPNLVVGHRNTSTLATQALYLMNSPFVIEQSRRAAAKLLRETPGGNVEQRLHRVYLQTIGRAPTATEKQLALAYLQQFDLRDRDQPSDVGAEEEHAAWASLYHALFASLDFRYIH